MSIVDSQNAQLYFVDPDIRKAETLPACAFTDKDFLQLELSTIFKDSWLPIPEPSQQNYANNAESLVDFMRIRGAHSPFSLFSHPYFLQRDFKGEGKLHCFPNVCTHAWYPLVLGQGRTREKRIICAQHGRQFNCDGSFLSQKGFETTLEFPRACDALRDIPVASWKQFLFVRLGERGRNLESYLTEMTASTLHMHVEEWKRVAQTIDVREVKGNWKQHAWNYMDTFHIPFIHQAPEGLADAIDTATYQTELYPDSALQWAFAKDPSHGFDPDLLPSRFRDPKDPTKRVFALWWFVFPNMTFNFYPWGLSVNVYMPVPDKPDRTNFFWYHYVLDEAKYADRNISWLSQRIDDEDTDAIGKAFRGISSPFAVRSKFAPSAEKGPHWFHRQVFTKIFDR